MRSSRERLTHTFIRPHPSLVPFSLGEAKRPPLVHPSPCAGDCPKEPGPGLTTSYPPLQSRLPLAYNPAPRKVVKTHIVFLSSSCHPHHLPPPCRTSHPSLRHRPCGCLLPPSSLLPGFHGTTFSGVPSLDTPSHAPSWLPPAPS